MVSFWGKLQHRAGEGRRQLLGCKRRELPSQRELTKLNCISQQPTSPQERDGEIISLFTSEYSCITAGLKNKVVPCHEDVGINKYLVEACPFRMAQVSVYVNKSEIKSVCKYEDISKSFWTELITK
jgi:hypothetical protein